MLPVAGLFHAICGQVQDSDEAVAFTPLTFERISISRDHLERVVIPICSKVKKYCPILFDTNLCLLSKAYFLDEVQIN